MTYQEFKSKYNNKYVDTDNYPDYNKYQCFDLAQQYFTECLGLPVSVLSGCGLVSNMLYEPKISLLLQYFDEVSWNEMNPGDVVVWYYGHIAIFDNYDGNYNNYFSQNYPLNSNAHIQAIPEGNFRVFRIKKKDPVSSKSYINIPPTIEERRVYNIFTKEQIGLIKPMKYGGLTYLIEDTVDDKTYAEINTSSFGKCLVKITDLTPITNYPMYERGNF